MSAVRIGPASNFRTPPSKYWTAGVCPRPFGQGPSPRAGNRRAPAALFMTQHASAPRRNAAARRALPATRAGHPDRPEEWCREHREDPVRSGMRFDRWLVASTATARHDHRRSRSLASCSAFGQKFRQAASSVARAASQWRQVAGFPHPVQDSSSATYSPAQSFRTAEGFNPRVLIIAGSSSGASGFGGSCASLPIRASISSGRGISVIGFGDTGAEAGGRFRSSDDCRMRRPLKRAEDFLQDNATAVLRCRGADPSARNCTTGQGGDS